MDGAERLVIEGRLLEARTKRHKLLVGDAVEQFVDQNGESVKYTKMNIAALESYIAELEGILNPALARQRVRRPLGFLF